MTVKERLHEVIERMTDAEAAETLRTLDAGRDPVARLIEAAPLDDEPFTAADAAALAEADTSGDAIELDDLRRELA